MANITKQKRDQMLAFLEKLKTEHSDDESVKAFNEIESHLKDKKFGLVFEEHTEEVDELLEENIPILTADDKRRICKDSNTPWNFIIEGDNLQALYLLEKTHRGRVQCIYIDPPYNTGARDWKYNNDYVDKQDVYRHSKWLSFMQRRLAIAKRLLDPDDSVLIVTIDEKEYLHLGCLLEEMFPEANMQMISTVIKPEGTNRVNEFSRTNEYIYFLILGDAKLTPTKSSMFEIDNETSDSKPNSIEWRNLRRRENTSVRSARPNQFYPFFVNSTTGLIDSIGEAIPYDVDRNSIPVPSGCYALFPLKPNGEETLWGKHYETSRQLLKQGYLKIENGTNPKKAIIKYLPSGIVKDIESGIITITGRGSQNDVIGHYSNGGKVVMPKTIWYLPSHNSQTNGSLLLKKTIGENRFNFPKSLYAVADCLRFFVSNKPDAIIVDFFAGSGTTMHAVNLLNAEDGGHRKCILVTNNEISEAEEKAFSQQGIQKGSEEWDSRGIAKYVTWPRTVCSIEGKDIFGNEIDGKYLTSNNKTIYMKDGFVSNVKYFTCSWTPRKPEDYLLSNALCLHIKEMIELQNSIEVDGVENVLLLNKDDIKKNILDPVMYDKAKSVWLNQGIVLNSEELKLLNKKGFKYIPREFFGQELREVAE